MFWLYRYTDRFFERMINAMHWDKLIDLSMTDMSLYNLVLYNYFKDSLIYNSIINTDFHSNTYNDYSIFKHK